MKRAQDDSSTRLMRSPGSTGSRREEDGNACIGDLPLPSVERGCTDKLFVLLIFAVWIAMTTIGLMAMGLIPARYIQEGNPELLLHGVDYEGNICGVDDPVKSLPKRVFPNVYGNNADSEGTYVPVLLAVCVSDCPREQDVIVDPYGTYGTWLAPQDSTDFLNNCLFVSESSGSTSATTIVSDFAHTAGLIGLLGFVLAVGLSLLFLFAVRIPLLLRVVVWGCAFIIQLLLSGGALYFLSEANKRNGGYSSLCHCSTEVVLLKVLGGVLVVCAVLWACILAFWRQKIALAISLVRESAAALTSMPLICLMPMLQTGLFAAFTAVWMVFCVYLVSSGTVETHTDSVTGYSYKSMHYDDNAERAILFMFFSWMWSIGFIEAVGQIACAHAVLTWYFADLRAEITSMQILRSIGTTLRYHSGSAAMGSLIIALLRGLRMALESLRRLDRPQANRLTRAVLCCSQCLMSCFDKCIKFFTKHAYIQVALYGTAFVPSAASAFTLLLTNLSRLAAVSVVGDFVVLVGKLSISLTCAAIGYAYMHRYMRSELNGFVLPTAFVFFVAFITSTMFLSALSATSDALLQACIVDDKRATHSPQPIPPTMRRQDFGGLYALVGETQGWKEDGEEDENDVVTVDLRCGDCDLEMVRVAHGDDDDDDEYDFAEAKEQAQRSAKPVQTASKQSKMARTGPPKPARASASLTSSTLVASNPHGGLLGGSGPLTSAHVSMGNNHSRYSRTEGSAAAAGTTAGTTQALPSQSTGKMPAAPAGRRRPPGCSPFFDS